MSCELKTLVVSVYIFILPFHCSYTLYKYSVYFTFLLLYTILIGGDDSQRATPVPIPNTEVKSLGADGTAGVAQWESRSSPPFLFFCFFGVWSLASKTSLMCYDSVI